MPTQSRPGAGRSTKKKSPAATTKQPAAAEENASEVTATSLERREIPSFSISREARIAEAAYWRAERRGFTSGQELDDWLAAEKEIDEETSKGQQSQPR
jgi:hypothetical protein